MRNSFYRIIITVTGTLDMQIGLEHYRHEPRTLAFTIPNQIFQKNNRSADASGYYLLFEAGFLGELLPAASLPEEFPFLSLTGKQVFQITADELAAIVSLVHRMDAEIRGDRPDRAKAVKLNLYLMDTPWWDFIPKENRKQAFDQFTAGIPAAREAQPEEIADAIVFLAGNAYMRGKVIAVDGGIA